MKMNLVVKRILLLILLLVSVACGRAELEPAAVDVQPTLVATAAPTATVAPTPLVSPTPSLAVTSLQDVSKATIRIESRGTFVDPESGAQAIAGSGSGFVIDKSGLALTNNHVVTGAAFLHVWVAGEDEPRNARVVGVSECSDLAAIDIDGEEFAYLQWYEGDVKAGLDVYAAGYPLGDPEFTLTRGIVSKARANGDSDWASVDAVIEHDAAINPGNSGGPLVTTEGEVVAINYAANRYNQYFAVAREEAMTIINQLRAGQDVDTIGVNGFAFNLGDGVSGIWVYSVASGSPADEAGVKGGDIITRLEGLQLADDGTMSDYCRVLRSHQPDDTLSIEVARPTTGEMLSGQLNGRPLAVVTAPQQQDSDVSQENESVEYVTLYDDTDALQVDVPSHWIDVNGALWQVEGQVVGAQITASPNLSGFFNEYQAPGVFFSASAAVGQTDASNFLDELPDSWQGCTYEGRIDYEDSVYTGVYDFYTGCGSSSAVMLNLAAMPADGAYLVFVHVVALNESDIDALDQVLATFYVHGQLPDVTSADAETGVVLATEFDAPDGWTAFTVPGESDYIARVDNSRLYIEVPAVETTAYAVYDGLDMADVQVDAGVETVAGPNRNNISLVCRYSDAGWYEFSMHSGGYWYIWKFVAGDGYTLLAEGASTAINLQQARNELTAVCHGNNLTFFINGSQIGSAQDSQFTSGSVGVSVTTFDIAGAGVEFDWLIATKL